MNRHIVPAKVPPPGRILMRELEARSWTQKDLAEIIGRPPQTINEIVRGTKQITPETALELAEALGTSAELWTNLEVNYRLYLARIRKSEKEIARRSRLYELAPVAELIKRGWISAGRSVDELEKEFCSFFDTQSPEAVSALARRIFHTDQPEPEIYAQLAWMKWVEHLVAAQEVPQFDRQRLEKSVPNIVACAARVEDAACVPPALLKLGVRFAIVPQLPGMHVDGASLRLHGKAIVALTLRRDRIDDFWLALTHELAHLVTGDVEVHLDNLEVEAEGDEIKVNALAWDWLMNDETLATCTREVGFRSSRAAIEDFGRICQRHPAIVARKLQEEGADGLQQFRSPTVRVSPYLGDWIDGGPLPRRRAG